MNQIIYYAIPLFIVLIVLELIFLQVHGKQRKGYAFNDTAASLSMGVGNVLISIPLKAVAVGANLWLYQNIGVFKENLLPSLAWVWVVLFFADDFCYYWFHRVSHRCKFAWAAHVNHHSSQHYNLSTALRQSWTTPFYHPFFFMPLAILGFRPDMILLMQACSLIYQFWIHTEAVGRMGPLEWVLNTPSHHRVHHGSNPAYIDKNYGGFLIIYDRLFGTFAKEASPVNYGLVQNIESFNPIVIATHAWVDLYRDIATTPGWRNKILYPLRPPEWQQQEKQPNKD